MAPSDCCSSDDCSYDIINNWACKVFLQSFIQLDIFIQLKVIIYYTSSYLYKSAYTAKPKICIFYLRYWIIERFILFGNFSCKTIRISIVWWNQFVISIPIKIFVLSTINQMHVTKSMKKFENWNSDQQISEKFCQYCQYCQLFKYSTYCPTMLNDVLESTNSWCTMDKHSWYPPSDCVFPIGIWIL